MGNGKHYAILAQPELPITMKEINMGEVIGKKLWEQIKTEKLKNAACQCEACGNNVYNENELICHAIYKIDENKKEIEIVDFACICQRCYDYMHQGALIVQYAMGTVKREYLKLINLRGDNILRENGIEKIYLPYFQSFHTHWRLIYKG